MPDVRVAQPLRSNALRTLVLMVLSVIGLSTLAAFAFAAGAHHRLPTGVRGLVAAPSPDILNSLLDNTAQSVGKYCPIPPRGQTDHGAPKAQSSGDTLLTSGQSVAPDSTKGAQCAGTAAPNVVRASKSDR